MTPAVGELIAGKYRVERVVGEGGMGVVLVAMHLALDQRVALKVLRSDLVCDDFVTRFAREARAAARIKSEHVARILDVTATGDGVPVLVMEYLEGRDLEQVLATDGALPIDVAADYVLQACEAMAEAHAAGIVHRDLEPGNLFLADRADGSRVVKVLDFGISKFVTGDAESARGVAVTHASAVFGSPLYMAPEQLASTHGADARADIWSLVVVLFELIAGSPPFDGPTVPMVTTRIMTAPTPSLCARRPDAPAALDALVQRGLQKGRERRFESVAELARALAPFAPEGAGASVARISRLLRAATPVSQEHAPTSVPPFASTVRPPVLEIASAAPSPAYASRPPRRALPWSLLAVVALATSAGGVAFVARSTPTAAPIASSAARPSVQPEEPVAPPALATTEPPLLPDAGARVTAHSLPARPAHVESPKRPPKQVPEPSGTAAFGGRQ